MNGTNREGAIFFAYSGIICSKPWIMTLNLSLFSKTNIIYVIKIRYYNIMTKKIKNDNILDVFSNLFNYLNNHIMALNNSKIFAGLMIVTLNISSKFVTFKLSKSMESYLKYTFSRDLLLFTIAWIGTRDIYIAVIITIIFLIFLNFLFNEDSMFCCLPKNFTDYHLSLLDKKDQVSDEDIRKAKEVLEKASKMKKMEENNDISNSSTTNFYTF